MGRRAVADDHPLVPRRHSRTRSLAAGAASCFAKVASGARRSDDGGRRPSVAVLDMKMPDAGRMGSGDRGPRDDLTTRVLFLVGVMDSRARSTGDRAGCRGGVPVQGESVRHICEGALAGAPARTVLDPRSRRGGARTPLLRGGRENAQPWTALEREIPGLNAPTDGRSRRSPSSSSSGPTTCGPLPHLYERARPSRIAPRRLRGHAARLLEVAPMPDPLPAAS